jgi:hypothetical protein
MMEFAASVTAGVALLEVAVAWQFVRMARRQGEVGARLARFADALELLTDTTESSFRAVALELGRISDPAAGRAARATNGKVARLARKGQSVQEIAVTEGVSEGEVRLRLRLAEVSPGRSRGGASKEGDHGALRAD